MAVFKECADIQTPDMLELPVPEAEYENVLIKPTEAQKAMVEGLAERAGRIRDRLVDSNVDNMLKVTNDGRKLALDQRLMDPLLPGDGGKTAACARKAYEIYMKTQEERATQLVISDLSTPRGGGGFNVYDDLRDRLVGLGVPPEEIAYIHTADTDKKKADLFAKVRSGQVRFLFGSTQKMGAGTNVQDRLIALHHLDCPWRPADLEQREGRIIRQGNRNQKAKIFRYVTESTFDSYLWQIVEQKQKFISQVMTSRSPARSCGDVDGAALDYAEVKALATGNPHIREKMTLDIEVSKLRMLKMAHESQHYHLEDDITRNYPQKIKSLEERIAGLEYDIALYDQNVPADKDNFTMNVAGQTYSEKKEAGAALLALCHGTKHAEVDVPAGEYLGMQMSVMFSGFTGHFHLKLKGEETHTVELGADPSGCITRIDNLLLSMPKKLEQNRQELADTRRLLETAKQEAGKPFEKEAELNEKLLRLAELNSLLDMEKHGDRDASANTEKQGGTGKDAERTSGAGEAAGRENADGAGENMDKAADGIKNRAGEPHVVEKRRNTAGNGTVPGTGKPSLRERLVEMKQRAAQGHSPARAHSITRETGMLTT